MFIGPLYVFYMSLACVYRMKEPYIGIKLERWNHFRSNLVFSENR